MSATATKSQGTELLSGYAFLVEPRAGLERRITAAAPPSVAGRILAQWGQTRITTCHCRSPVNPAFPRWPTVAGPRIDFAVHEHVRVGFDPGLRLLTRIWDWQSANSHSKPAGFQSLRRAVKPFSDGFSWTDILDTSNPLQYSAVAFSSPRRANARVSAIS